jgi:hypothetical protein
VIALAALIAGCAAPKPPPAAVDVPVESWEQVAVGEINARIDRGAGDARQSSPLSIALGFLGGDAGARSLTIDQRTNRAEAADTTVIVIVRDGLPDDSVRGDWHRIVLRRLDDRTWRVHEARRAFRCWRGHHTESYGSEWCP